MDKTLYDLMDWAGIEEIVYSEAANPHRMLGAHMTPEGMLVQAFIPTARDITVKLSATGKQYQMEMADETGFFAALIPRKTLADYTLITGQPPPSFSAYPRSHLPLPAPRQFHCYMC